MATNTTEFWLISAPGEKTCQQTWENLNIVTAKQNNFSVNHKFHIPDLKVTNADLVDLLSASKIVKFSLSILYYCFLFKLFNSFT